MDIINVKIGNEYTGLLFEKKKGKFLDNDILKQFYSCIKTVLNRYGKQSIVDTIGNIKLVDNEFVLEPNINNNLENILELCNKQIASKFKVEQYMGETKTNIYHQPLIFVPLNNNSFSIKFSQLSPTNTIEKVISNFSKYNLLAF